MSNFIKLTLINGNPVYANVDFIGHITGDTYYQRGSTVNCTRICLTTNNNGGMQIKETIEEVLSLMGKTETESDTIDVLTHYTKKVNNRMELIMDDVNDLRRYIYDFSEEDKEEIQTHLNNIEIASDLTDTEADAWYIAKND